MAETANVVDTRIEPQPPLVFTKSTAPKQNQFYKIPASALSNSFIAFNNLTTLGADRAYLDTFELEITAELTFTGDAAAAFKPDADEWVFDSFPFNKCCEEARININGGAFFSQPLSYVRAKERYWNEMKINASYENVCPCNKPHLQNEMGVNMATSSTVTAKSVEQILQPVYATADTPGGYAWVKTTTNTSGTPTATSTAHNFVATSGTASTSIKTNTKYASTSSGGSVDSAFAALSTSDQTYYNGAAITDTSSITAVRALGLGQAAPTRLGAGSQYYMPCASGMLGGGNNSIVRQGFYGDSVRKYEWLDSGRTLHVVVQWREPIFASPFSSRIDSTFGRPLYNITSMDLAFNMQDLGNMIRVCHLRGSHYVQNYTINLQSVQLCYQVETVPPGFSVPKQTVVPYRRMIPYITDFPGNSALAATGGTVTMTSGVYTLNEIPTAIWIFAAPTKNLYQTNPSDSNSLLDAADVRQHGCWASNKLFGFLKHISISMANTTQILNTADILDLYRIAKSNGCQDSFKQWGIPDAVETRLISPGSGDIFGSAIGPGSVLRLMPGQDIVLPEQDLIPGSNANNMVFQCEATFDIPAHSPNLGTYALWLLFEYVGMATIAVGKCNITMNPLGDGSVMRRAPVVSATSELTEGEAANGAGVLDILRAGVGIAKRHQLVSRGADLVSRFARSRGNEGLANIAETAGNLARMNGLGDIDVGEPLAKRGRGGAIMGMGDFL